MSRWEKESGFKEMVSVEHTEYYEELVGSIYEESTEPEEEEVRS